MNSDSSIFPGSTAKRVGVFVVLAVIVIGAAAIRVHDLSALPDGLYCDEAANGYDAYCLAETGKSMVGEEGPMFFNHFGIDYVEPMYIYATAAAVHHCGLTVSQFIHSFCGSPSESSTSHGLSF